MSFRIFDDRKRNILRVCGSAGAVFLGGVYLISGMSKVSDLTRFADFLFLFDLPSAIGKAMIFFIPGMELALGASLSLRIHSPKSGVISIVFLIAASACLIYLQLKGEGVACACFSETINNFLGLSSYRLVVRNGILIGLSYIVIRNR